MLADHVDIKEDLTKIANYHNLNILAHVFHITIYGIMVKLLSQNV